MNSPDKTRTTKSPKGSELFPLFLRTAPDNIVYLKYVLESYEGVGIVRTLNEKIAEIVVLATCDTLPTVRNIISAVQSKIELHEIPPPESMKGDWLLAEEQEALFTSLTEPQGDH